MPFYLLLVVMILSYGLPAQTRKNPLRPSELIENANAYLNQSVDLEILEPLYGPSRPEDLVRAAYGQVEVRIPEGMSGTLSLVPAAFKATDPNRYRNKFDRVIESPVRVKGELLSDDEMSKATRRPFYVVRVLSMDPIVMGPPHRIASLDVIKNDPAQWDRKQISYEGIYQTGFEVSVLDEMWLDTHLTRRSSNPATWDRGQTEFESQEFFSRAQERTTGIWRAQIPANSLKNRILGRCSLSFEVYLLASRTGIEPVSPP